MALFGLSQRDRMSVPELQPVLDEMERLTAKLGAFLLAEHNEDGTHAAAAPGVNLFPTGGIIEWTTDIAPNGFVFCHGQTLSRIDDKLLFTVIGTQFGIGDGSLTFNVPDMTGRFPLGRTASGAFGVLGLAGGALDHTHSIAGHTHSIGSQAAHTHTGPSHTHPFTTASAGAAATADNVAAGADLMQAHDHTGTTDAAGTGVTGDGGSHDHGGSTGAGSGTSGTANPPYLTLQFIIAVGRATL